MLLVFSPSRDVFQTTTVSDIVDINTHGNTLRWKLHDEGNEFVEGIHLDDLEIQFLTVYVIAARDGESGRMGVGESMIKWLVWQHEYIGDLLPHEAVRYIKKHPYKKKKKSIKPL